MKIIAATFIYLILSPVYAGTIFCSHSELCKMAALVATENHLRDFKTQNLVVISGDPHEFEPSTAEIKSLLNAPLLLTGPNELSPWIKKVVFQRSKNPALKTISLLFEKKHLDFYPNASAETLSHFWLYPKIYCSFKEQLGMELKKHGEPIAPKKCDSSSVEKGLAEALSKIKKPMILTHDALLPLLLSLDPEHLIVPIKGSGHHEETGTESIKKMYKALESPSVIWIVETSIHVPANILSKVRPTDVVINIDTANSSEASAFSVINLLTEKLKAAGVVK